MLDLILFALSFVPLILVCALPLIECGRRRAIPQNSRQF